MMPKDDCLGCRITVLLMICTAVCTLIYISYWGF